MTYTKEDIRATLYKHRHRLIPYGIPIALFFLLYSFYLNSSLIRIDELKFLSQDRTNAILKMHHLLKREKEIRKDIDRSQTEIDGFRKNLHNEGAGEKLIKDVLTLAKSKALSITALEAERPVSTAFFDEVSLKISLEGAFSDLLSFVRLLEAQTPSYKVSAVSLRSDEKGVLRTTFQLKAFIRHENK
jgi:Tfp pilus assembly protein PilO